jgi:hypothetical protein
MQRLEVISFAVAGADNPGRGQKAHELDRMTNDPSHGGVKTLHVSFMRVMCVCVRARPSSRALLEAEAPARSNFICLGGSAPNNAQA